MRLNGQRFLAKRPPPPAYATQNGRTADPDLKKDLRQSFYYSTIILSARALRLWVFVYEVFLNGVLSLFECLEGNIRAVKLAFKRYRFCPFISFRPCGSDIVA